MKCACPAYFSLVCMYSLARSLVRTLAHRFHSVRQRRMCLCSCFTASTYDNMYNCNWFNKLALHSYVYMDGYGTLSHVRVLCSHFCCFHFSPFYIYSIFNMYVQRSSISDLYALALYINGVLNGVRHWLDRVHVFVWAWVRVMTISKVFSDYFHFLVVGWRFRCSPICWLKQRAKKGIVFSRDKSKPLCFNNPESTWFMVVFTLKIP